jgi:hypothetical protein
MPSTPAPKSALVLRIEAAQDALDTYRGQPFAWGENDCARLAAHVLRRLGYRPNLAQFGGYRSDKAARRALKARGMANVLDWMDSVKGLARIPPAAALPGDIIAFPGAGGWDGLAVALGNGRILAFTEAAEAGACSIIAADLGLAVTAWSAAPCRNS